MQLKNYYWCFQKAVPERVCDEIVRYAKSIKDNMAVTGDFTDPETLDQIKDLKKKRDSNVVWLNDPWIFREIQPYIHKANKNAEWNFQWDCSEHCQFTKYNKGQYYTWHRDGWGQPYDKPDQPNEHKKIRKLSVTLSLSDEKDYEGGELEFDFGDTEPSKERSPRKCTEIRSKGSLIVFPSFVWHRVCPVKSGTRYSLVVWSLGWPFK
jgi:PKHD-type hydroxylase